MANEYYQPGEQRAAKVNDLFAGIARRYDRLNDLQSFGLHRRWKNLLVDLAAPKPGDRVLDVCCGTGDISLQPTAGTRLAYLVLWPHARAWRLNNPQPSLRSIPDAEQVAHVLGEALQLSAAQDGLTVVRVRPVSEAPHRSAGAMPSHLQAAE